MIRLGVLTLIWRRHELARFTMEQNMATFEEVEGIEMVPQAIGSEGITSERLAREVGYHYEWHPNRPFSDKHLKGLGELRKRDVDAVIKLGSDDLVSAGYLEGIRDRLEAGHDYIRHDSFWFYDLASKSAFYSTELDCGDGRVMSAELLDRIDWMPWEPGRQRSVDAMQTRACAPAAEKAIRIHDLRAKGMGIVDIKGTGENIWSYDFLRDNARAVDEVEAAPFLRHYFGNYVAGTLQSWDPAPK